ncbi:MAG TPA: MFS transporter [Kofleriaceae bacterium]|nr:MFS transporter [Kofleriaceae bacterium]
MKLGRALRHRNYRLFFAGQGVSLVGTWLTKFAMSYQAYALSHDPFLLGLVAFASQAPTAVITPIAGVLVDRWDRHRVLVVTQALAMLQSVALAVFALAGAMTVGHLVGLAAVQAVINAFDVPARQAFVRQMVDDAADLPNAIALNSSLATGGRLVGPLVAAALVAVAGVGGCYAIDAASYLAVIASLLAMRVAPRPPRPRGGTILRDLAEGVAYASRTPLVRALLLLLLASATLGGAYVGMLPAIAQGTLHGGSHTLGILLGVSGAGALVGLFYLASRHQVAGLEVVIGRCAFALAVALCAFEAITSLWLALPVLFLLGTALVMQTAATNTLLQATVDPDKLGRVMSLYAMVYFAGAPLGALALGSLGRLLGPTHAFALAGVLAFVSALAFRLRRR